MKKVIIAHLSARRDYDVASILYKNNLLERFFTDGYYNTKLIPFFRLLDIVVPSKISSTYKKYQPRVNDSLIGWNWYLALKYKISLKLNREGNYAAKISANKQLQKDVIKYCKYKQTPSVFYGFDAASIEFFEWGKPKGYTLFLEQCGAPRSTTLKMHAKFEKDLQLDESIKIEECIAMQERERKEWKLADTIIVPSQFVYDELVKDGVPTDKIKLVNYGFSSPYSIEEINSLVVRRSEKQKEEKVVVLFCGNAGLRKGIQDLLQVAFNLRNENVEFRIVGDIESRCQPIIDKYPNTNVVFTGKLNSEKLKNEYVSADIFTLPSYIEGSAMVNFEAMSWKLPIITTYQSGSIVEHGVEGYIFEAGDVEKLQSYILELIKNSVLRNTMGTNAMEKVSKYSIENYEQNLLNTIHSKL